MGDDDEGEQDVVDNRLGWLEARVSSTLKCKPDKLGKMKMDETSRNALIDFLDDPDIKRVFVFPDTKGDLLANHNAPATYKKNSKVLQTDPDDSLARSHRYMEVELNFESVVAHRRCSS
jgi:hypothetical protein